MGLFVVVVVVCHADDVIQTFIFLLACYKQFLQSSFTVLSDMLGTRYGRIRTILGFVANTSDLASRDSAGKPRSTIRCHVVLLGCAEHGYVAR